MSLSKTSRRFFLLGGAAAILAGCARNGESLIGMNAPTPQPDEGRDVCDKYEGRDAAECRSDETRNISRRPIGAPAPQYVTYAGEQPVGTIIINNQSRNLYFIHAPGKAIAFRIAIGKVGRTVSARVGDETIFYTARTTEWPVFRPDSDGDGLGDKIVDSGINNPMGARAIYLQDANGHDDGYRIHGTREPWLIGGMVSNGCFRMFNDDAMALYDLVQRYGIGGKVFVLNDPTFEKRRIAGLSLPSFKLTAG